MRIAQQICGDLAEGGPLKVLRLGNRWDLAFHNALKRDGKGDVIEFDIEPQLVEEFGTQMSDAVKKHMKDGSRFAVVAAPDARPYVRMIVERMSRPCRSCRILKSHAEWMFPRSEASRDFRRPLFQHLQLLAASGGLPVVLPDRSVPDGDPGVR